MVGGPAGPPSPARAPARRLGWCTRACWVGSPARRLAGPIPSGRQASILGRHRPVHSAPLPAYPAQLSRLDHSDLFAVAWSIAEPLAPGLSNKRIRSRLRAIYP